MVLTLLNDIYAAQFFHAHSYYHFFTSISIYLRNIAAACNYFILFTYILVMFS